MTLEQTEVKNAIRSFLTFRLMDELFAIDVVKVIEILEITRITKVPKSPDFLLGVINLRGNVLPVIDARIKFGMPGKELTQDSCIIVMSIDLNGEKVTLGALVDAVSEVLEVNENTIQEPPSIGSRYNSEFMEGLVKINEEFVMILKINKAFSSDEADELNLLLDSKQRKANNNN
jgi:purine-binding chemotaxis protein CheW